MFGNLAEMAKLMSKAKEMQNNLKSFKEEMPKLEFTASAPGNSVSVTVSGDFQLRRVQIAPDALADRELLETQLVASANAALLEAKKAAQEKMNEMTGGLGLNLPGIF